MPANGRSWGFNVSEDLNTETGEIWCSARPRATSGSCDLTRRSRERERERVARLGFSRTLRPLSVPAGLGQPYDLALWAGVADRPAGGGYDPAG